MRFSTERLLQRLSRYQPGRLLAQIQSNLADMEWELLEPTRARFRPPTEDFQVEVRERLSAGLLMHTVSAEFVLTLPAEPMLPVEIAIKHTGMARRTGVGFEVRTGDEAALAPLLQRLRSEPDLARSLMALDFTSCRLHREDAAWTFHLVHYGASEVSVLFPPYRRYIRLNGEQTEALLRACRALVRILE